MAVIVEEINRLDVLQPEWDRLLQRSAGGVSVFSTWDWQALWWQAFGANASLRLLAVRDAGILIGIWPLAQEGQSVALLGGTEVCDYLDIIALGGREKEVLAAGLAHISANGLREVDLRFLRPGSPTIALLPSLASEPRWVVEQSVDDVCPIVELPADWDSYLASLKKKDRHELRRKLRHLQESGAPELRVSTRGGDLERDIADFVRLHRLSQVRKAAFMDDLMEDFFHAVIVHFQPLGTVRLYFLSLDGQRVAATLCFDQGEELWVYNSGFDRAYAAQSVGLALKAYCIEDAIAQRKRRVDFLRGREPYKYDLGAHDVPVYRLRLSHW